MRHEFHKMLKGSALIFSSRLSGAILVFITQIYLARWMGAEQFGYYVYAFSLCTLISIICCLGYPAAGLRIIGHNLAHNGLAYIHGFIQHAWRVIAGFSLIAGCTGAALVIVMQDRIPAGFTVPLVISLLSVPVFAVLRLDLRVAHAMSWFKLAFIPNMALRPLLFLLAVYIAWQIGDHLTATIAMLLQSIMLVIVTVGQYLILRRMLKPLLQDTKPLYEKLAWLRIAAPLLLITLFSQFTPEISVTIIGTMLPPHEIAIFNASYRVALFIGFGLAAVNSFTTPRVSQMYAAGDRAGMQHIVSLATQIKFWPALTALLVLVFFGRDILGLFGDDFLAGYNTLLLLGLAQLVLAAVGPADVLLSVTGHQKSCLKVFAFALAATVILNLTLVPVFGINGAAAVVLIVVLFWSLWLHTLVVRHLDIRPSVLAFRSAFGGVASRELPPSDPPLNAGQ